MEHDHQKTHGVHYTPPELARFLARVTVRHLRKPEGRIKVLDPACGAGSLLTALCQATLPGARQRLALFGFDQDAGALDEASRELADWHTDNVTLQQADFLTRNGAGRRAFDVVIANPPYVRTQVLGAEKARKLAKRFGLSGQVDLYQAFVHAMADALAPGGVLGLLTPNRLLSVKSGETLRRLLRTEFQLQEIHDLGDTRLFGAAVLPVVLVARKGPPDDRTACRFSRVYQHRPEEVGSVAGVKRSDAPEDHELGQRCVPQPPQSLLEAMLDRNTSGAIETRAGRFAIERGTLSPADEADDIWSLRTPEYQRWLDTAESRQAFAFGDLGVVRVGIKTCADRVFLRSDWDDLPEDQRPEPSVLRPLITHAIADRWRAIEPPGSTRVLYPHETIDGKRRPLSLASYPNAAHYLESHRERLESRKYVLGAGRKWYEIWVAHKPADWPRPKIVFPDISERPRFFLDRSGAIVNGDCYWITLRADVEPDWLMMMLAVANSSFITKYYDIMFHNWLYAGRRRFMAQYVKRFPLPRLDDDRGRRIVRLTSQLVSDPNAPALEAEVDDLVWRAFGLTAIRKKLSDEQCHGKHDHESQNPGLH